MLQVSTKQKKLIKDTILFTACNSQETLWTTFMDLFITKSTFYKPKMAHAFPENYRSKGVGHSDACRESAERERYSRYSEHKTGFPSVGSTYWWKGLRPLKIISLSSTDQAWFCRTLLRLAPKRDFYKFHSSQNKRIKSCNLIIFSRFFVNNIILGEKKRDKH